MLGVLVLEHRELLRRGIADTIDAAAGMRVVAEAATLRQAVARAEVTSPDVAVVAARIHGIDGDADADRAAWAAFRRALPGMRWIVLTDPVLAAGAASAAAEAAPAALEGAAGFLTTDVSAHALADAIRYVAAGHVLAAAPLPHAATSRSPAANAVATLPPRQRQVLDLLASGMSNREIADRLGIAEKTVKNHVTAILRTLGAARRTQAALIALRASDTRHP